MKLIYKLTIGYLIVSLLVGVVAYFGFISVNHINSAYNEISEKSLPVLDTIEEVEAEGQNIISSTNKVVLITDTEGNDSKSAKEEIDQLKAERIKFDEAISEYDALVNKYFPQETVFLENIKNSSTKIEIISDELIASEKQGDSREKILEKWKEFQLAEKEFRKAINQTFQHETIEINEKKEILQDTISTGLKNLVYISLLTVAFSIVMGFFISRNISKPINTLKNAALDIEKGSFETRVDIKYGDEVGVLADAFNLMAKKVNQDITDLEKAKKNIEVQNIFSRTVINSMNDAVSVIDVRDFRIIDTNSVFLETYGLKKEDVMGKTCYEIVHKRTVPCTPPDDICPLMETVKTGKPSTEEHIHCTKDGEKRYVEVSASPVKDENGNVISIIHMTRDITERKKSEDALLESEERYRHLVDLSPYGIAIHLEGKIIYMNLAGAKILGTTDTSLFIGKPVLEIVHPDYHELVKERIQMQEEGKKVPLIEEKFLRVDGTPVDIEIIAIPFNYQGKKAMYGVFQDMTEHKNAERIRLENERLINADRTKNEFLATMSHELRTPLNAVLGFSELLKRKMAGGLNEKQEEYVDHILEGGKHQLNLIDMILDMTRIEAGKLELALRRISVPQIIEEVLSLLRDKAMKRRVALKTEFDPALGQIFADRQKFMNIMFNLVDNAIKFSKPEGGTVTITVKKVDNIARFSISDTGIGIKDEDMGKLFVLFQQIDSGLTRKYGGAGLGLTITKQLVELHGGMITAKSKYGEGSTFTFTLPIEVKNNGEKK
ncbi:MAG: PAS domain S-box protein [Candidatus Methanoperedens sp.]|nr:PAS domain S-box protein [Candidatus Methanoperedens sp.]